MTPPRFRAGRNIAMKVPAHQYAATVRFYREILGLKSIDAKPPAVGFEFGASQLWIDAVASLSQAEIWLEIVTDDIATADRVLAAGGAVRCDHVEDLPEDMQALWISSPASIIHLVCTDRDSW
jgi:catechol 2,3-dioxygenase-like lactoylglutathione lyase family enzyme